MTLYRSMRAGEDGRPVVARARWSLGVRIEGRIPDIQPDGDGMVHPLSGGMSIARDWHDMGRFLLPPAFGGSNTSETMFGLAEEALPADLAVRQAGPRKGHYVLEPRRKMPIEEYEALLKSTRGRWVQVTP